MMRRGMLGEDSLFRLTLVRMAVIGTTIEGAGRAPLVRGQK